MSNPLVVRVDMEGGVIHDVDVPPGVVVKVHDQEEYEEKRNAKEPYTEAVWTPDPDDRELTIAWSVGDVRGYAKDDLAIDLTSDEAHEALRRTIASHDADRGIGWHSFDFHIRAVVADRPAPDAARRVKLVVACGDGGKSLLVPVVVEVPHGRTDDGLRYRTAYVWAAAKGYSRPMRAFDADDTLPWLLDHFIWPTVEVVPCVASDADGVSRFEVAFSVMGNVKQTVEIARPGWTAERLQSALEDRTVFTTIQDNGEVEVVETGEIIGRVVNVDNECEYDEFQVTRSGGPTAEDVVAAAADVDVTLTADEVKRVLDFVGMLGNVAPDALRVAIEHLKVDRHVAEEKGE